MACRRKSRLLQRSYLASIVLREELLFFPPADGGFQSDYTARKIKDILRELL